MKEVEGKLKIDSGPTLPVQQLGPVPPFPQA